MDMTNVYINIYSLQHNHSLTSGSEVAPEHKIYYLSDIVKYKHLWLHKEYSQFFFYISGWYITVIGLSAKFNIKKKYINIRMKSS